jgi:hypothetical protein
MDLTELATSMPKDDFRRFVLWTTGSVMLDRLPMEIAHESVRSLHRAYNGVEFTGDAGESLQRIVTQVASAWQEVQEGMARDGQTVQGDLGALLMAAIPALKEPDVGSRVRVFMRLMPLVNIWDEYRKYDEQPIVGGDV